MKIIVTDPAEAEILKARWRALVYTLLPKMEIEATLPNGEQLVSHRGGMSAAAQCHSLIERAEDMIERHGW